MTDPLTKTGNPCRIWIWIALILALILITLIILCRTTDFCCPDPIDPIDPKYPDVNIKTKVVSKGLQHKRDTTAFVQDETPSMSSHTARSTSYAGLFFGASAQPADATTSPCASTAWMATAANVLADAGYGGSGNVQDRAQAIYDRMLSQFGDCIPGWTDAAVSWYMSNLEGESMQSHSISSFKGHRYNPYHSDDIYSEINDLISAGQKVVIGLFWDYDGNDLVINDDFSPGLSLACWNIDDHGNQTYTIRVSDPIDDQNAFPDREYMMMRKGSTWVVRYTNNEYPDLMTDNHADTIYPVVSYIYALKTASSVPAIADKPQSITAAIELPAGSSQISFDLEPPGGRGTCCSSSSPNNHGFAVRTITTTERFAAELTNASIGGTTPIDLPDVTVSFRETANGNAEPVHDDCSSYLLVKLVFSNGSQIINYYFAQEYRWDELKPHADAGSYIDLGLSVSIDPGAFPGNLEQQQTQCAFLLGGVEGQDIRNIDPGLWLSVGNTALPPYDFSFASLTPSPGGNEFDIQCRINTPYPEGEDIRKIIGARQNQLPPNR